MNFSLTIVRKSHFSLTEEYNCSRKREKSMNQINVVTIGKLIEAHRDGDEQKFKAYVNFIRLRRKTPCFSYGDIRRSET